MSFETPEMKTLDRKEAGEMLAGWNEGDTKAAIVDFVTESATEGSSRFIPPADRIAAFDNDGTLWVEQPIPVQGPFLLEKLMKQIEADPSLTGNEPYKAIVNRDEAFLHGLALQQPEAVLSFLKGVGAAWEGATPSEYEEEVREYLSTRQHERFGRPYTQLVYRPMIELFNLLKACNYRVYVCSGGGRDFMRVISEETWGILRENVIGSAPEFEYRNGRLIRQAELRGNLALGGGKPEHIFARTGRVARFAAGNGDVDKEMLDMADFSLVILHDDAEREYAYTEGATDLLAAANRGGWTMVSMKNDWKTIFEEGGQGMSGKATKSRGVLNPSDRGGLFRIEEGIRPYTHLRFKNDPGEFQFAIIADNSGSGRPGVLSYALKMANLLQPEFVLSLGDLIEGYMDAAGNMANEETYRAWWKEVDDELAQLDMPFFFLPGNHDLNNPASVKVWRERHGGSREYYHFVYKNVLFLIISTEDPPKDTDALRATDPGHAVLIDKAYAAVKQAIADREETAKILELLRPIEEYVGTINISDAQVEYFKKVLEANPDVRWTFCLMHSPAWWTASGIGQDPANFTKIEALLADRPYTVFAAHTHLYNYMQRNGRDYITTSMSGAMNIPRLGAIDHLVWITMTGEGPKIANLLLNGILDKKGPVEGDATTELGMYRPKLVHEEVHA